MPRGGKRPGAGRPKGLGKFGESTTPVRVPSSMVSEVLNFAENKGYQLPLYGSKVAAGLPAPADDYVEGQVDLNQHLIRNPSATFCVRVTGESMLGAGIHPDDLLIVDKSVAPKHKHIVVAAVDGELTVKRLYQKGGKIALYPENDNYPVIELTQENDMHIWGVVKHVIHDL